MEFAPLAWSWLTTIIGSFAIAGVTTIIFIKDLAKQGYKINLEKMKNIYSTNNTPTYLSFFVPIFNLAFSFHFQNTLYKKAEELKTLGMIIPMNEAEKEIIKYEPTLNNILGINLNETKEKIGIITYKDKNNKSNKIQFLDKNGIVTIEEVSGPDIELKNRLEQRAFLLQLLRQEKLESEYESLKKITEEAINKNVPEILFTNIEKDEITIIAYLIANYGNQITINIAFEETITQEEEKENLLTLKQTLKEISNMDILFDDPEKTKTLTK